MAVGKIRVLIVPDTRHWILGRIATAIAGANEGIEATVISRQVLLDLLDRDSRAVGPFDLVHFVVPGTGRRLMDRFWGAMPIVTTMHHFDETQPMDLIERGDVICVVAGQWREWFRARGWSDERLWLMPNGVATDIFHPWPPSVTTATRRRLAIDPETPVIGFVGKPAAAAGDRKGSDVFVEAISILRHRLPKLTALIIGPGWDAIRNVLGRAGVQCVNLPFVLEHRNLSRLYAAMDLYWVTARIEGGPCTLLEAMSTGTCVVTTPVGMARDVVRDGVNGFLVREGDPVAVAERSLELLEDTELRVRIGAAGRASMVNGYDWRETVGNVWELYNRASVNWKRRTGSTDAVLSPRPPQACGGRKIDWNAYHLPGVKPEWQDWVRAMEDLHWMQQLNRLGATRAARRLAQRAVRRLPFDREVWRGIRGAFPNAHLVRAICAIDRLARRAR